MTLEQKRIAIEEACGWHIGKNYVTGETWCNAPDYFTDLNAMHEAEKVLTDRQYATFYGFLIQITGGTKLRGIAGCRVTHSATAAQRCEAFGMTLKLW